jgi:hypothetical protein
LGSKVSSTGARRRRTFTSALLETRRIAEEMPGWPPQSNRGDEIACAICEEREGDIWTSEGRLICAICDGDLARGLV